jgi:hypothetical protein
MELLLRLPENATVRYHFTFYVFITLSLFYFIVEAIFEATPTFSSKVTKFTSPGAYSAVKLLKSQTK